MARRNAENLQQALDGLASDKATERQQARDAIRSAFERSSAVLHFDKGDGKAWLVVFQKLFVSYLKERKPCESKSGTLSLHTTGRGSIAVKRLSDVASVIRWLTERSLERLNTRVLKALLHHCTFAIVYKGKLVAPVVLDYAKTINSILHYKPHLCALKDDVWHVLVGLSFNIVLNRAPRRRLIGDADEDDMDVDSEEDDDNSGVGSDGAGSATPARKRVRHESTSPGPSQWPVPRTSQPVSLEQIEFMSVLATLLRSPNAPLLSEPEDAEEQRKEQAGSGPHRFPRLLLGYFAQFLRTYTGDTSLHHDFLIALSAALSHLTLNCRKVVTVFARESWESLVSMWGTKNQALREHLLVILRQLFPLLTAAPMDGEPATDNLEALSALWQALDSTHNRGAIYDLSLDSLQLYLPDPQASCSKQAFTAGTFQHGWHFDADKALTWSLLELQADCAQKLYQRSEATYAAPSAAGKRLKLENPIGTLLHSINIKSSASQQVRSRHMQTLLFVIDRHWHTLHEQLRQDILTILFPLVSCEDNTVQSWTFLCLAAIAHSSCSPGRFADPTSSTDLASTWDPIWTHAILRANVPAVSRAACHAAHVLLTYSKSLLSSQRVLLEIEAFAKNLDVQGLAYPYDSVCDFVILCLRVANQDVRLYRMQMEEKVLSWLTESWRIGLERPTTMPLHTVAHIHSLLEAIVGSSKRVRLQCNMILPDNIVVDTMVEEVQTSVIRDFQLHARLPPFQRPPDTVGSDPTATAVSDDNAGRVVIPFGDSADLAPPRGRERRISAFLLKSLDEALMTLATRDAGYGFPTAERIRSSMDLSVTAFAFEASLVMNGTQSNRRVLQASCKLLGAIMPLLVDSRWKPEERRLIIDALHPLIRAGDEERADHVEWETLVPPGERTGIRKQVLRGLVATSRSNRSDATLRRELQRFVFRSADVQDAFSELLKRLREMLSLAVGKSTGDDTHASTEGNDADGFGPVRAVSMSATVGDSDKDMSHNRHIVDTCITALAVVPILQSSSGEPTRDRTLTQLILGSTPDAFLVLMPPYCEQIKRRTLNFSNANLESFLQKLEDVCVPYVHKHRVETLLLVVQILDATSHIWLQPDVASSTLGENARFYCWEAVKRLNLRRERSWKVQDAIIRFLDKYLLEDPKQAIWQMPVEDDTPDAEDLPAAVLPAFCDDDDIRIRFRVASACPRLFAAGRLGGRDLMATVYKQIHAHLSTDEDDHERILSRFLCLGNIVISEASVRRGAYWHLLEIAYYSATYSSHLKSVLTGIVERIGMKSLAELFNCYASQFAYSIRRGRIDLFKFPPELLGFSDRKECAEATFHAFAPSNLLGHGDEDDLEYGRNSFLRHCQTLQKTEQAGVEECFADLVSYEIVYWLNEFSGSEAEEDLNENLRRKTGYTNDESVFRGHLKRSADGVVVGILKSLGEQDVSANGAMAATIGSMVSESALETFRSITKYRSLDTFQGHSPNLPFYTTPAILRALDWYHRRVKQADSPAVTYHVLQQLFADIEHCPLLNEQYRLLNAVCLWVACHHDHFQDESLLRTLTRRAVTMLAQVDLARGAQSLLDWCLALYRASSTKADYRLADVFIRISTIAHDFSQSTDDKSTSRLGRDLLVWALQQANNVRSQKAARRQVARALAAWPRELPSELQKACEGVKLSELTSVLIDHGVSASKFRLVRRIYDLASQEDADEHFSASDFWRLKACIPPQRYLVNSDIDAFTSLLMVHRGQVDSIGSDQYDPETVRALHRRTAETTTSAIKEFPPRVEVHVARHCIIASLRSMLDTSSATQAHVAYQTLRALLSIPTSESYTSPNSPADLRQELEYLQTFSKPPSRAPSPDLSVVLSSEGMLGLASDFDLWIARITTLLCEVLCSRDPFFAPLAPILRSDHDFADEVLPILVHSLLQLEYDAEMTDTPTSARAVLSNYFTSVLRLDDTATACCRAIINVVLHLRNFHPSSECKDALAYNRWLSMDFTLLSRCAARCNAYTTALLFLELSSDFPPQGSDDEGSTEDILFEIYSHIDEPDGFYGIQTDDLRNFFVKRLRHEKQWDKALRFHGAVVESGSTASSNTDGIVQSLYAFGFNRLALNTMQSFSADVNATAESSSLAYNLGWRAGTWDLPDNLGNDHSGATLYLALRAVYRERNPHVVDNILSRAFVQEMNRLRDLGNENFTEIREVTQNLMCLTQIRKWRSPEIQQDVQSKRVVAERWNQFASLDPEFDFSNIEAIMATRIALIRFIRQKEQHEQIGDLTSPFADALLEVEKACLLCLSERSRDVNQTQIALNSIVRAQNLERISSSKVSQEFANVLWLMKEPKLAIKTLTTLTSAVSLDKAGRDPEQAIQHALLLARLGTWSAEASMQKPSQIAAECFAPAADLVSKLNAEAQPSSQDSNAVVFHQYANFAEKQYHAITRSPDALRWKLWVDRKKQEVEQREKDLRAARTNGPEIKTLENEKNKARSILKQDLEKSQEHLRQRMSFLTLAVEMYSRCLEASNKYDEDAPIRLCSLWLANFEAEGDQTSQFGPAMDRVPSHKFVFLAHQLTARLSTSDGALPRNQEILQRVILKMGRDHPFHSLFPLYCLRPEEASTSQLRRQPSRSQSQAIPQAERAAAVSRILAKLQSDVDQDRARRVQAVVHVCNASLEWAKHPIKHIIQKNQSIYPVPDYLMIRQLKNIKVPVVTAHTPIDLTTQYSDCVWISSFENRFITAGGVNVPKINKCLGSDGKLYKQLYKGEGNDDLRQDAVMEQVFDLVNVVLRHDRETRRRKLSVRGYKVIPLAAQAGVIEFVENTTPLANWLRPAHVRYNPKDVTPEKYSGQLHGGDPTAWRKKPQEIIKRFIQLRERFKPVMRHWFTEKHKTPMPWFAMRLHYSRSVATTSIVGHILGLGDRHTSNILLDTKTGEAVHIDLGIAFEQGKLLPQPERVPFRLTADMVDGLGISGTQGVFQRCAEETMRVLRDGSETILTVLEVFKYDPLHSWTASEYKVKRAQKMSDEAAQLQGEAYRIVFGGFDTANGSMNEAADRALSAVTRKLDKTLSVEYTVNELITEASDPANLALMYLGWAPHW